MNSLQQTLHSELSIKRTAFDTLKRTESPENRLNMQLLNDLDIQIQTLEWVLNLIEDGFQ